MKIYEFVYVWESLLDVAYSNCKSTIIQICEICRLILNLVHLDECSNSQIIIWCEMLFNFKFYKV